MVSHALVHQNRSDVSDRLILQALLKGIHIFKPGQHTSSQGQVLAFTEDHLKASVTAYDPALHEAPIVIGHPKENAPAWGWVSALAFGEERRRCQPCSGGPGI